MQPTTYHPSHLTAMIGAALLLSLGCSAANASARAPPPPFPLRPGLDFNCTHEPWPLSVVFPPPIGAIACGSRHLQRCPTSAVQTEPLVTWPQAELGAGYVVAMIDGTNSARHWLVGNVPGAALRAGFRNENTTAGLTILSPYYGPHPPPPTASDPYHVRAQSTTADPW